MILFETLHHQEGALLALRSAWESGRLPHAYLFWGTEGVGKMRSALALAQNLFCRSEAPPCGSCSECNRVARLTHPDLHVILPALRTTREAERKELEAYAQSPYHCLQIRRNASIGIERIRSLKLETSKARVERGCRMILIRDAERMTLEAAQAALKLIEEPQANTFLVLTCADPTHLLPTILSRCQRLRFRSLPRSFVEGILREHLSLAGPQARMVAGLAQGSLSRALALGEEDALAVRDQVLELFEDPPGDAGEVGRRVQALGRAWDSERARTAVDLLMTWYGDLVSLKHGLTDKELVHSDRREHLQRQADACSMRGIKLRLSALEEMLDAIEGNVNPLLALQAALLRIHGIVQ